MKEVEKIKNYIDAKSECLAFEIYSKGGCSTNKVNAVITHVLINADRNIYDDELVVYDGKDILFRVYENWFELPSKSIIQKRALENYLGICHHWSIRKLQNGSEQFVLSYLSTENYLKSLDIAQSISEVGYLRELPKDGIDEREVL